MPLKILPKFEGVKETQQYICFKRQNGRVDGSVLFVNG
ncbi:MAG: hypothetical protein ANABAC_2551 [Anaerolineae bacterium]|nr:MAG: hypothetical protein ANABAC_2551 [Anaerolineae bacterium]